MNPFCVTTRSPEGFKDYVYVRAASADEAAAQVPRAVRVRKVSEVSYRNGQNDHAASSSRRSK